MSLINKMLQDLDERRATALERDGISRHVRTLPPSRTLPWKGFVLGFAGALGGAAVAWLALTRHDAAPALPAPAVAPVAKPAVTPPPVPAVRTAEPPRPSVEPARKEARPPAARADARETALKFDRSLEATRLAAPPPTEHRATEQTPQGAPRIEKQARTPVVAEAADAEYRKGLNLIKRGAIADAAAALRIALRTDPGHLSARQALLSLLVDQKQWDEAQALGAEGLALDPKQAGWAMLVARLQVERGEIPSALDTLEQHSKYAESNADYLSFHALLLQKAKRHAEAVERYRAALALRPGEGRWWYGLGLALESGQRMAEAKEAYAQARATANLPEDLAAAVEQKLKGP